MDKKTVGVTVTGGRARRPPHLSPFLFIFLLLNYSQQPHRAAGKHEKDERERRTRKSIPDVAALVPKGVLGTSPPEAAAVPDRSGSNPMAHAIADIAAWKAALLGSIRRRRLFRI